MGVGVENASGRGLEHSHLRTHELRVADWEDPSKKSVLVSHCLWVALQELTTCLTLFPSFVQNAIYTQCSLTVPGVFLLV